MATCVFCRLSWPRPPLAAPLAAGGRLRFAAGGPMPLARPLKSEGVSECLYNPIEVYELLHLLLCASARLDTGAATTGMKQWPARQL